MSVTLQTARRVREGFGDPTSGNSYRTTRGFFDFMIDGASLHDLVAKQRDMVSVIWDGSMVISEQQRAIERLLGERPGDATDGRVSVYVCPECGDIGCGAITCRIEVTPSEIVWKDFGFENGIDVFDRAGLASVGPFRFSTLQYQNHLRAFLSA